MNEYLAIALKQAVGVIAGGLITYLISVIKSKKQELAAKDAIIDQLIANDQAQLRRDIVTTYYVYKGLGYMPTPVKESLYKCHERYHASGGNGFIDEIMARIKALPEEEI